MNLVPIAERPWVAFAVLYGLLAEREPWQSISHKAMPTTEEHQEYIRNHPHKAWYLIVNPDEDVAGAVYLGAEDNIGVGILRACRRLGYGYWAIHELMREHPRPIFRANINPQNWPSKAMFGRAGFRFDRSEPNQDVYLREVA